MPISNNINVIELFEKIKNLPYEKKRDVILALQSLDMEDNYTDDKKMVSDLMNNFTDILSIQINDSQTRNTYIASKKESVVCFEDENKIPDALKELNNNDSASFLLVPIASQTHALELCIRRIDNKLRTTIINAEKTPQFEGFTRPISEIDAFSKTLIDIINNGVESYSTEKVYDELFKDCSERFIENLVTGLQKADNCHIMERMIGEKYAHATSLMSTKEIKDLMNQNPFPKALKFNPSTEEINKQFIDRLKEKWKNDEVEPLLKDIYTIYSQNKSFRSMLKSKDLIGIEDALTLAFKCDAVTALNYLNIYSFMKIMDRIKRLHDKVNLPIANKDLSRALSLGFDKITLHKLDQDAPIFLNDPERAANLGEIKDSFSMLYHYLRQLIAYKLLDKGKQYDYFDPQTALKFYRKAVDLNPNCYPIYTKMGYLCKRNKQYSDAIKFFQEAIQNNPYVVDNYYSVAQIYFELEQYNEVVKYCQEAIVIKPDDIKIYHMMARVYTNGQFVTVENYSKAVKCYEDAIKIKPNDVSNYHLMAEMCCRFGRYDDAIKCYEEAMKANPNDINIYESIAQIYYNNNKFDEVIKVYQKSVELNPKSAELYYKLGMIYLESSELDRKEKSIDCFKYAMRVSSYNSTNYQYASFKLGNLYEEMQDYKSAANVFYHAGRDALKNNNPECARYFFESGLHIKSNSVTDKIQKQLFLMDDKGNKIHSDFRSLS